MRKIDVSMCTRGTYTIQHRFSTLRAFHAFLFRRGFAWNKIKNMKIQGKAKDFSGNWIILKKPAVVEKSAENLRKQRKVDESNDSKVNHR